MRLPSPDKDLELHGAYSSSDSKASIDSASQSGDDSDPDQTLLTAANQVDNLAYQLKLHLSTIEIWLSTGSNLLSTRVCQQSTYWKFLPLSHISYLQILIWVSAYTTAIATPTAIILAYQACGTAIGNHVSLRQ